VVVDGAAVLGAVEGSRAGSAGAGVGGAVGLRGTVVGVAVAGGWVGSGGAVAGNVVSGAVGRPAGWELAMKRCDVQIRPSGPWTTPTPT
jgi:hypothetical protein